jgi:hypothetical protein
VLLPAAISLLSGLWAVAEWRNHRGVEDLGVIDLEDREAAEQRQAAAAELAERKLRLAEAREARLAGTPAQAQKEAS